MRFIYRLIWVLFRVLVWVIFLFFSYFLFCFFLFYAVSIGLCCCVMGGREGRQKKKNIVIIIFLYPYRVLGLCAGRNGGGRFFVRGDCALCVGGLVRWALCAVVLSLGCLVALSRVFSFWQGTCMPFLRKCLKMDLWASLFFPCLFFVGFAYLPHILSLCLGWGRCMFYIRTHAEGDTHIEDVRPVRGGV